MGTQHPPPAPRTDVRFLGHTYLVIRHTERDGHVHVSQTHLVGKDRVCMTCESSDCQGIEAVARHLRNGGRRAPDPLPHGMVIIPTAEDIEAALEEFVRQQESQSGRCPVCQSPITYQHYVASSQKRGYALRPDRIWRCSEGGFAHYYETRYGHVKDWFTKGGLRRTA